MAMQHILILEDEVTLRSVMARALRELPGVEVSDYGRLSDAIASLSRKTPSLVVSDIQLPDGSGLDLLPELSLRGLSVPIVVVSAHLDRFSSELGDSANIEILPKPFELGELKRVARQRLEQARAQPVPAFAVADYLQLAGLARRSVALEVHHGTHVLGRIFVEHGEPRFAMDEHGAGQPAFQRLALASNAEVSCRPLLTPTPNPNLSGSLEQQLIEAAQRTDESERDTLAGARATSPTPPSGPPRPLPPPRPRRAPPPRPSERARTLDAGTRGIEPSTVSPSEETRVIPIRPSKPNLNVLLNLDPALRAVARADRHGSLQDSAGDMDAETACAVAMMAARHVGEASADLGLGQPTAWHVSVASSTWYVVHAHDSLFVAVGNHGRNALNTLRKLSRECAS